MDVFLYEDHLAWMERELKERKRATGTGAGAVRKHRKG